MTTNKQSAVNFILGNKIVMDFLKEQAANQVASDINGKTGGAITSKGVVQLMMSKKNDKIAARFQKYLAASVAVAAKMREEATA